MTIALKRTAAPVLRVRQARVEDAHEIAHPVSRSAIIQFWRKGLLAGLAMAFYVGLVMAIHILHRWLVEVPIIDLRL